MKPHPTLAILFAAASAITLLADEDAPVSSNKGPESGDALKSALIDGRGRLPHGIEVQVLDLGYAELYEKQHKKPADWFTSHGDVSPTSPAKMKPFPPVAPNGQCRDLSQSLYALSPEQRQRVMTGNVVATCHQLNWGGF